MATTTATISVSSNDLVPGARLSINATSTLMQTGLTTGLDLVDLGKGKLTEAKKTEKEQIDKARKKSSSPINTPKYPNFRR